MVTSTELNDPMSNSYQLLVGMVLIALSVHLLMSVLFPEVWFGAGRALADMIQDVDAVFDAFVDGLRGPFGGGR